MTTTNQAPTHSANVPPLAPTKGDAATLAQVDDQTDSPAAAQDQADKDAARRTRSERLPGASTP